jgi:hypothetical protein
MAREGRTNGEGRQNGNGRQNCGVGDIFGQRHSKKGFAVNLHKKYDNTSLLYTQKFPDLFLCHIPMYFH